MTLEEAIKWCAEKCLNINFAVEDEDSCPLVAIMDKHDFIDRILGTGKTVEEAVQDAIKNGSDRKPAQQGMFIPGFMADMMRG